MFSPLYYRKIYVREKNVNKEKLCSIKWVVYVFILEEVSGFLKHEQFLNECSYFKSFIIFMNQSQSWVFFLGKTDIWWSNLNISAYRIHVNQPAADAIARFDFSVWFLSNLLWNFAKIEHVYSFYEGWKSRLVKVTRLSSAPSVMSRITRKWLRTCQQERPTDTVMYLSAVSYFLKSFKYIPIVSDLRVVVCLCFWCVLSHSETLTCRVVVYKSGQNEPWK